jgi:hypothetical protein
MYLRGQFGNLEHPQGFGSIYEASTLGDLGAFGLGDIGAFGITDECQRLSDEMERTYTQPWRDAGLPQSGTLFDRHKAGLQRVRECNLRSQNLPVTDIGPIGTEERSRASRGEGVSRTDTSLAPDVSLPDLDEGMSTAVKVLLGVAAAGILGGAIYFATKKKGTSTQLAVRKR